MENSKRIAMILAKLVLVSFVFSLSFAVSSGDTTLRAYASEPTDPVTGEPYGDLMQYEWPMWEGSPQRTMFSAGPAPDRPDVLWRVELPGAANRPAVFDGKMFVTVGEDLYAFDAFTGNEEYHINIGYRLGYVYQIDDAHFIVATSGLESGLVGNGISCFRTATGALLWTQADAMQRPPGGNQYYQRLVVPEEKKIYSTVNTEDQKNPEILCRDMSDPSAPFPDLWRQDMTEPLEILCYGDGKIFVGGLYSMIALDASNGNLVWKTPAPGMVIFSAMYYNGNVYQGGGDTSLTCYEGTTGKILWTSEAGHRSYFSYGGAAGYGKIYQHTIYPEASLVGAWDAGTGELTPIDTEVNYYIGYIRPALADGKLFICTGEPPDDPNAQVPWSPDSHFTCYDAFSGKRLWRTKQAIKFPAVAYGNLYCVDLGEDLDGGQDNVVICMGSPTTPTTPTPWSMWRGSTDTPGVVAGLGPSDISNYKWKYTTDAAVTGSPAVVDGKVYIGSLDKNIYCLNAYSGSFIWKFPINYDVRSTPAVVGGRVYVGPDDGSMYCINAETGAQIWKTSITSETSFIFYPMWQPRSSPIVIGDRIYVGALDGNVYCLNTAGSIQWSYPTGGAIGGSPAVSNDVVYITSTDRQLYALNAADGTLKWNLTMPLAGTERPENYVDNIGSPIVVDGKLYIGGERSLYQGVSQGPPLLLCIDATNGDIIWSEDMGLFMPGEGQYRGNSPGCNPTVGPNGLVYTYNGFAAAAYNATTGERLWQTWLGHDIYSSPVYADDPNGAKVYYGCDVGTITCLDATTGDPLSWYVTGGQVQSSPALWDGKLYVGSADFNVYCFDDAPTIFTSIHAESNKGAQMWSNETAVIRGKLSAPADYTHDPRWLQVFHPGIPSQTVTVTFMKPDQTMVNVTATTDLEGNFEVSYNPNAVGSWSWIAWFEGDELLSHSYTHAYSDTNPLEVIAPPEAPANGNGNGNGNGTVGIPMEYVYAIVAVIAIVIIAVGAYAYMRRKK